MYLATSHRWFYGVYEFQFLIDMDPKFFGFIFQNERTLSLDQTVVFRTVDSLLSHPDMNVENETLLTGRHFSLSHARHVFRRVAQMFIFCRMQSDI